MLYIISYDYAFTHLIVEEVFPKIPGIRALGYYLGRVKI